MQIPISPENYPIFNSLASPTRLQILNLLAEGPSNIHSLAQAVGIDVYKRQPISSVRTSRRKLERCLILKAPELGPRKRFQRFLERETQGIQSGGE